MVIRRSYIAALHDIIMAALSFIFALYLRLGENFHQAYDYLLPALLLFTIICGFVFHLMHLYKGVWRYASLQDLVAITKSVTLAVLIFLPLMFMLTRLEGLPRSVLFINWLVLLAFLGGPRFLYRLIKDKTFSLDLGAVKDKRIPVLLVGISDTSELFLRESRRKHSSDYKVVAIVDDDKTKEGRSIHGVKVYGDVDSVSRTVKKLKREGNTPRRIIIGSDHMDGTIVRDLLKRADLLGLTLAKLPKLSDFKDSVEKVEIKPIAIEDILGRPQNAPRLGRRRELIEGRKILVTGAGGTIGSEVVRQIAAYNPARIILLELSEYNLYAIDRDLAVQFSDVPRNPVIGDVRNISFLDAFFEREKPHVVFHAAALKHVPIVEENISEALLTNIVGTKNVADMCIKHNVEKMVLISTDKAVNPSSIMGATKRIAELYVQSLGHSKLHNKKTDFATVRFGNVLGSSGSVIPLFQKQLESGGPITITHPDMTRYFMTISEAVELVLQASTLDVRDDGDRSAIFVLNMGEPVRIKDLATQMIKLAGFRPGIDIKIKSIGIRAGEKLYEELFYVNEVRKKTIYEDVLLAEAPDIDFQKVCSVISKIEEKCLSYTDSGLVDLLLKLVPEYKKPNEN